MNAPATATRLTFNYDVTICTFDGRYDREQDVSGTYSIDPFGAPGNWRIETWSCDLGRDGMEAVEDEVAKQIDADLADAAEELAA